MAAEESVRSEATLGALAKALAVQVSPHLGSRLQSYFLFSFFFSVSPYRDVFTPLPPRSFADCFFNVLSSFFFHSQKPTGSSDDLPLQRSKKQRPNGDE
jgi:hypothetical protein